MTFVTERRAIAAAVFSMFALMYGLMAFLGVRADLVPALVALASCYGAAFFVTVAGYFWGRWFAMGVALFGLVQMTMALYMGGLDTMPLFFFGAHLAATLALWGNAMGATFEGKKEWRERFHMDDNSVHRLGKAIMRAGFTLPILLVYAFAPKEGAAGHIVPMLALVLAALGIHGMVHVKTWGVLALGAACGLLAVLAVFHAAVGGNVVTPMFGAGFTAIAATPFAGPIARALRLA